MSYNKIYLGKIRTIDYMLGVGEVVTSDGDFMFTIDDISTKEELHPGDLVKFRGEKIHDIQKAYFVSKINKGYKINRFNDTEQKKQLLKRND
jgi:hypothetical protein